MTKQELLLTISNKLQKQMHLINSEKQRANPKMLCDNLASRVLTELEVNGIISSDNSLESLKESGWED